MKSYQCGLIAFFALSFAFFAQGDLTDAQKFNGLFAFVNQTLFYGSLTIYSYTNGPNGGIYYVPAYPGASFGNMTALWGDQIPEGASANCTEIQAHAVGYGGGYVLDPADQIVTHYPGYGTAPTLIGVPQTRHYTFYENDNLLNLRVINNGVLSGTLFWRRVFPLVVSNACDLTIASSIQTSWVSNGQRHTIYDISVTNNGSNSGISITIDVAAPSGTTLESTSQVSPASTTNQYVAQLYGLAPGSSYEAAQFQFAGSGVPTFRVAAVQC